VSIRLQLSIAVAGAAARQRALKKRAPRSDGCRLIRRRRQGSDTRQSRRTFEHLNSAEIVDTPEVRGLSDHAPIVVDLVLPEQAGQPRAL
jgi:hypothetical protein